MEVKPGYKRSAVGVIPEGWDVKRLGEIATIATGNTPPTRDLANYGDEFLFVSPVDLGEAKHVTTTEKKLSKKGFAISRRFPKDSILFVCIGSTIGKCGVASVELTSNQQINAIFPSPAFSVDYLYYSVCTAAPKIRALAGEQAVPIVNKTQFSETAVALPRLPEQRAIARALSDADALIGALDQLITKKRDLKQAAMQQLLTGQKRLPGFHGEWQVKRLGDVADVFKGAGLSKASISASGARSCILYGELFTTYKRVIQHVVSKTNSLDGRLSQSGDVLVPGSTTTEGIDLATASALLVDGVELGGDINIIREKGESRYDAIFLANYLTHVKRFDIAERAQGITIIHLYGRDLLDLSIELPTPVEQTAISEVLSDMDAELAALTQRRDKTRALKQGMMQELLTGRTRLV